MTKAKKVKQLSFTMATRIGLLQEIGASIAAMKVNIDSICAYDSEDKAHFMLTTDSPAKAKKAIGKFGTDIDEKDVLSVEMPNKVGELQKVLKKLADAGINIIETYGSTGTGRSSACVFSTSDNTKAIRIINK